MLLLTRITGLDDPDKKKRRKRAETLRSGVPTIDFNAPQEQFRLAPPPRPDLADVPSKGRSKLATLAPTAVLRAGVSTAPLAPLAPEAPTALEVFRDNELDPDSAKGAISQEEFNNILATNDPTTAGADATFTNVRSPAIPGRGLLDRFLDLRGDNLLNPKNTKSFGELFSSGIVNDVTTARERQIQEDEQKAAKSTGASTPQGNSIPGLDAAQVSRLDNAVTSLKDQSLRGDDGILPTDINADEVGLLGKALSGFSNAFQQPGFAKLLSQLGIAIGGGNENLIGVQLGRQTVDKIEGNAEEAFFQHLLAGKDPADFNADIGRFGSGLSREGASNARDRIESTRRLDQRDRELDIDEGKRTHTSNAALATLEAKRREIDGTVLKRMDRAIIGLTIKAAIDTLDPNLRRVGTILETIKGNPDGSIDPTTVIALLSEAKNEDGTFDPGPLEAYKRITNDMVDAFQGQDNISPEQFASDFAIGQDNEINAEQFITNPLDPNSAAGLTPGAIRKYKDPDTGEVIKLIFVGDGWNPL